METISINDFPGIRIGQTEDTQAATGVTVIMNPNGMAAGIDVRGGGPASRDTRILDPLAAAERIHAVVLGGGSAFGLDAAGGVQQYLEEQGVGLDMGVAHIPLVCQSDIFDLGIGRSDVRPDAAMGYAAATAANTGVSGNYQDGNFGAGCGATVGKILGPEFCMKSGIGSAAFQVGPLMVGVVVVVNALGDVFDPSTGQQIAGLLSEDKRGLRSSTEILLQMYAAESSHCAGTETESCESSGVVTNTTIGAIITNANLPKTQLCKVASMAHDGMARCIAPVHTSMDGDTLYALSVGDVIASVDIVGTLAAQATSQAILKAVQSSDAAHGLPSYKSLKESERAE